MVLTHVFWYWPDTSTGLPFRHRKNDFDFSEETFITSITATTSDSQRFITSYGLACTCARATLLVCSWERRKPQQRCPVTPLQSNVPLSETTLSVSFKHHWVYFLHRRSENRVTCVRVCASLHVCVDVRWLVEALHPQPTSSWYQLHQSLTVSADGVVPFHIETAVPTCTLAWLDHPSLQRLWGPPSPNVCCAPCVHKISGLSGECLPSWNPTVSHSLPAVLYWLERKSLRTHALTNIRYVQTSLRLNVEKSLLDLEPHLPKSTIVGTYNRKHKRIKNKRIRHKNRLSQLIMYPAYKSFTLLDWTGTGFVAGCLLIASSNTANESRIEKQDQQ